LIDKQQILEVEQALTGLVKLLKALRFYPKGHPSLQSAIDESMTGFSPLLARQHNQAIQTKQTGFSFADSKVGENNLALPDLALMLAERRVNQLIFLPELTSDDLLIFLEGLTIPAEEIYQVGGFPKFLNRHKITTIWLNENSLEDALQKRQQLVEKIGQAEAENKQQAGETAPASTEKLDLEKQLRALIEKLKLDLDDDSYRNHLDKLLELAPGYFEQSGAPGILRILPLLLIQSQQGDRERIQRKNAASALERLLTERVVAQILEQFKQTTLTPQQFQRLQKLIVVLGMRIAPQILKLMSKEMDVTIRKRLNSLLGQMGEPLLDLLREMRHDNKWYVVRNAVTLIGDLRLEMGIDILTDLTVHPDQRVRRALIRSLAMIGGKKSVAPLLTLTQDQATALRRPAVKALGATNSLDAVRPLLKIAQSFDPFGRQAEIRSDAVSALGSLGKKEAYFPLLALAKRPNLLRLKRLEELRAEIILALGKLGETNLDIALTQWRKSPHGIVRRAAEQSQATLMKKHDNLTTN